MRIGAFALAAMLGACAGNAPVLTDHPLAGRVWDSVAARFIEPAEAEARIAAADIALLGETHDNPVHHAIQERLLRRLLESGKRPAVAMEQIDTERQAAVDAARADAGTPDVVNEAGLIGRNWPWPLYRPLVAVALEEQLPIVAANLSRGRTRDIVKQGLARLGEGEADRLGLASTWSPSRQQTLRRLLVEGHCGDDSPVIGRMVDAQRARDGVMAERILDSGNPDVIAIIGRGHARKDLGVPIYLRHRAPGRSVVSLGMVEVVSGKDTPEGYSDAAPGVHDLVWFTPRQPRPDPCARK